MLLGLAACGGTDDGGAYTVTVTGQADRTALVAFRDGSGPWQSLTLDAAGEAHFEVTAGFHALAYACGSQTSPPTTLIVAHGTDTDRTARLCGVTAFDHRITGTVAPADAAVWVRQAGPLFHQPGTYEVGSFDGTLVDVAATSGGSMQLVRDVVCDGDRVVNLSVPTDGFSVPVAHLEVTGGTAPITTYSEILTANKTWVRFEGDDAGVRLFPASRRIAGDRVVIGAHDGNTTAGRTVQRELPGDAVEALPLPAPLVAQVDRAGVQWNGDWPWFSASLEVRRAQFRRLHVSQYGDAAWLERRGAQAIEWLEPAAIPGWDPAWGTFMPGEQVAWRLRATRGALAGDFEAVWSSGDVTW